MILFNFGDEDFVVNMGDKIAHLVFEKIKTPTIKETNEVDGTGRGDSGYGSTGINSESKTNQDIKSSDSDQSLMTKTQGKNEDNQKQNQSEK